MPAAIIALRIFGDSQAGPMVATILVFRIGLFVTDLPFLPGQPRVSLTHNYTEIRFAFLTNFRATRMTPASCCSRGAGVFNNIGWFLPTTLHHSRIEAHDLLYEQV